MNLHELDSYNLADAVKFHNRLNPRLWDKSEHLLPEVHNKLLEIAADFQEFLGVPDLDVVDITVSGSNAAYSYTPHSDIDLHLVVRMPEQNSEVFQELFNAKKYQYNDEHDIRIGGADVELYVQPVDQKHHSLGIYSVKNNDWVQVPRRRRIELDDQCVAHKTEDLAARIDQTVASGSKETMQRLWDKIKTMRQTGLEQAGEFGCDNLVFKMLRRSGHIERLKQAKTHAHDRELSITEKKKRKKAKKKFTYGSYGGWFYPGYNFNAGETSDGGGGDGGGGESVREVDSGIAQGSAIGDAGAQSTWDGVSPDTDEYLSEEAQAESIVRDFIRDTARRLGIQKLPHVKLHNDDSWSENTGSFGRYEPETHELHVNMADRHIMDILRTTAHELTHCRQHELSPLPADAGDTGSSWENQAHATAGVIMRDYAGAHPEMFDKSAVAESSGYIPTDAEKNDPRFVMALSPDVRPGATGKNANKMALKTDSQGRPQIARTNGLVESLAREFEQFDESTALFEIKMTGKNLRAEAAKTGALAGMEFEMIVPNVESDVEPEMEPDMDQDQRARSFDDVRSFFDDGDYNSRRNVNNLLDELSDEYEEWHQEQTAEQWVRDGVDYMRDYIEVNDLFDRDQALDQARDEVVAANPDLSPESEDFQQLVNARINELQEQFVLEAFEDRGRIHDDAFETFADEQREEYDERSFFDDRYQTMSDIQSNFDIEWPYYYDINDGQSGDMDGQQVADEFSSYMGKPVNYSSQYHGGRREPGTYVVEPDGSLEGDNPGDGGLEFVSPPMPIDEMISDLNKVKAWADKTGCYTNDSTGLHINVSVPNYSIDRLDYVKLAILMGDERVLNEFGRLGNTYAKSAMSKIKSALKQKPEAAAQIMDLMKQGLDGAATKAIHTGITDKYTSINTKTGYIEFRSPGGDWLDSNFSIIENTLLRFVVAMSAAIDPEAYRKEYLTKLYKLLSEGMADKSDVNVIQLFSNYSAGELDKPALIRQVRAKQLARNVAKGKATGKMWWKVSNPDNSFASIEVVASSKEEAIDIAVQPGNYPDWARVKNTLRATPLRPYTAPTPPPAVPQGGSTGNWGVWVPSLDRFATIGNADRVAQGNAGVRRFESESDAQAWIQDYNTRHSGNDLGLVAREVAAAQPQEYEVFDRDTGATVDTFTASNDQEVARGINNYRTMGPHNLTPEQAQQRYGLRRAGSTPIARQPQFQEPNAARGDLNPRGPGPWEIYRLSDNSSVRNLTHTDRQMAGQEARMALGMRGEAPELYGVRTRQSDTAQGGTVDVAGEQPAAPQTLTRPGQGQQQFTGTWRVLDPEDREIYRFSGVGNNQSDANRVAMNWMRQNPGRMQAGVTVVPEMQ